MKIFSLGAAALFALFVVASPASAETVDLPTAQKEAASFSNIGVEIGGGMETYTGRLGDVLEGGAGLSGRVILGTKSTFGAELGYLGTANPAEESFESLLGETDVMVYSNNAELLGRVNILKRSALVKPFVAGGVGYSRLDADVSTPIGDVEIDDVDSLSFPLVAGLQAHPAENFTIGLRANYTFLTNIIDDNFPDADQWGGILSAGATF